LKFKAVEKVRFYPPTPQGGLFNLLVFNKSPPGGFRGVIEKNDFFNTPSGRGLNNKI